MDKIIIEKDILFEADGLDDGIIVSKGYSIKQVDEATNETYKVSKTFSTIVEGNRVFIAKDTILSIGESIVEVEAKKKYKVMYDKNEMEIQAIDLDECKNKMIKMAKIEEVKK